MGLDAVYDARLRSLRDEMAAASVEHLWVQPSIDFLYLTGIETLSLERFTGLLIGRDDLRLVVPLLLREDFAPLEDATAMETWDDSEGPDAAVERTLRGVPELAVLGSLPMWGYEMLRRAAPDIEVSVEPQMIAGLREVKDEDELAALRASADVTDEVVGWIGGLPLAEMMERELAGRIQARYLEMGHIPPDWALVATGANASMPHYTGGDVPIALEQPLLTDLGGAVDRYWSDTTRVHFPKNLDPQVASAYDVVCAAYDAAFAAARPGATCHDVDGAARSVIEQADLGEYFVHRTGHGVGLEVHEGPFIRSGNEQELRPGNVFTIEPGVYLPHRFGLRYENVVVIGDGGPEALNKTAREHVLG